MQKVSKEYKASMKDSLRERAYIMISFGVVNQEAQAKAEVDSGEFAYFSNPDNLFNEGTDDVVYATLEENFTRVDGSMYFLPRNKPGAMFYNTGLVGKNLVSDGLYEVTINLHAAPTDFRGITINFGENYPTDFDFVTNTGQKVEFRDNDKAVFTTEEVLENVTTLTLVIHKMKNLRSRLRIYSFRFGYGLVYYNDSVMSSSLESYVSPIGADIPQIDFSVTLKNYDKYFNVDNPKSAINFLETGQEMDIYYGYQLPNSDEIEWVRGNHLLCSEWESDDYTATIRCQDVFRNMDTEYYKGLYAPNGKSYYDLAIEVLKAAGEKDYYVDPRLKKLYTKNPVPRVSCKEALQIIANACRCVLSQSRVGTIQIKSSFVPEAAASSNGETDYSHVAKILTDDTKDEYATLASNYTTADGTMFFLPRAASKRTLNTGFISEQQSDADGKFTTNPKFTDLYIGDYWVINGVTYRIAAFDYYYNCGDTNFTKHHVVIVPDTSLYKAQMNTSNVTTGGYTGSAMYKSNLAQAKTTIKAAFGSAHVLTKRELLTNAVNGNTPSGWAWFDSDVELMNEVQAYGSVAWGAHDGNGYNVASGDGQFPLFMFDRTKLHNREDYWLRDVASATLFSYVGLGGCATDSGASASLGVRPAFCIG